MTARRAAGRALLAVAGAAAAVGLAEAAVRASGHDFAAAALARVPIAYRRPDVDLGGGVRRRAGPAEWRGRPLQAFVASLGHDPALYADEAEVEVRHDADGFRNPAGLADWDVVLVGDSFVEAGTLAEADAPATVLGARLGCAVKALGVSGTGPRAHVRYLEAYGRAPRCREAVLVFFEGNDVVDLLREELLAWGEDPDPEAAARARRPQRSLVGAARRALQAALAPPPPDPRAAEVVLGGATFTVDLGAPPPGRAALTPAAGAALGATFAEFARVARAGGARPWLAYLPLKARVLLGAGAVRWRPGHAVVAAPPDADALPPHVLGLARAAGLEAVDLTPPLLALARAGTLPYHPLVDHHLSAAGSRAVGEALAEALRGAR